MAVVVYYVVTDHFTIYRYVEPFWMFTGQANVVLWTMLAALLLATLVVSNLYCRFLCPVGAMLGVMSQVTTLFRIKRWSECKTCRICERTCEWGAIRGPQIVSPSACAATTASGSTTTRRSASTGSSCTARACNLPVGCAGQRVRPQSVRLSVLRGDLGAPRLAGPEDRRDLKSDQREDQSLHPSRCVRRRMQDLDCSFSPLDTSTWLLAPTITPSTSGSRSMSAIPFSGPSRNTPVDKPVGEDRRLRDDRHASAEPRRLAGSRIEDVVIADAVLA